MTQVPATALIVVLFLVVAALIAYGAHAFGHGPVDSHTGPGARVDMGREVIWTAAAAMLLLVIFAYAR
jgi:heme/copper-type cytochrome/quinol oxidase subunit 2